MLNDGKRIYSCTDKDRIYGNSMETLHFIPVEVGFLDSR